MDEHWERKISVREHHCDMLHVLANGFPAGTVFCFVCLDFDGSAIGKQMEMMTGHRVAESHTLVAPLVDSGEVSSITFARWRSRWGLLGVDCGEAESKQYHDIGMDSHNSCIVELK